MHSATNSGILGASLAEEINDSDLLKTALQGIQPTIQMNLRLKWMVNLQIRKKCRMSSLPQLMFQYVFLPSFNVAGSDIINDPMPVLPVTVLNNQVNSSVTPFNPTHLSNTPISTSTSKTSKKTKTKISTSQERGSVLKTWILLQFF